MTPLLLFVLVTGSAYRATRLVTTDTLFDRQRDAFLNRFPSSVERGRQRVEWKDGERVVYVRQRPRVSKLGQLVDCPWCIGFWITGAVVGLTDLATSLPLPLLWWPAASTAVGLLGKVDG